MENIKIQSIIPLVITFSVLIFALQFCKPSNTKTLYWPNGNIKSSYFYPNPIDTFEYFVSNYYENGQLKENGLITVLEESIKRGQWEYFYPNGSPYMKCFYKENKLNEHFIRYYKNGVKREEGFYGNDEMLEGEYASYYENGNKNEEGTFLYNKKIREWKYFNDKGKLIKKEFYTEWGDLKYFDEHSYGAVYHRYEYKEGNLFRDGFVENDVKIDKWNTYNEDASLLKVENYRNDSILLINLYDNNGKLVIKEGNGIIKYKKITLDKFNNKKYINCEMIYKNGFLIKDGPK